MTTAEDLDAVRAALETECPDDQTIQYALAALDWLDKTLSTYESIQADTVEMVHSREDMTRRRTIEECAEIKIECRIGGTYPEAYAYRNGWNHGQDSMSAKIRALLDEPSKNPGELRGPTVGELMGGEYGENKSFAYHPIWDI